MYLVYKKHMKSYSNLYYRWQSMKGRCYNKNNPKYKHYGGRGIKMCDEWLSDFMVFYNWSIKTGYREDLTIDRIDVNGNYEPSNCRWASDTVQRNNKRNTVYINCNGKTQSVAQWSRDLKIPSTTIRSRHNRGWTDKECLFGRDK